MLQIMALLLQNKSVPAYTFFIALHISKERATSSNFIESCDFSLSQQTVRCAIFIACFNISFPLQ